MKFALATLGTRGDVEPYAAVGRELQRRGHEVSLAVAPNYIGFVESAGLAAVAHGRDQVQQNQNLIRKYGNTPNPISMAWEIMNDVTQLWPALGTALTSLADGPTCYWRTQASRGWPPMLRSTTTFRWLRCTSTRQRLVVRITN